MAVKKLHGGRASGMNEVCNEFLKTLDVVGLSWFTHLYHYISGEALLDWQNGVVPLLKKADWVFSNSRIILLLCLPQWVYARVL